MSHSSAPNSVSGSATSTGNSDSPSTEIIAVLGVPFAKVTQAQTIERIEEMIRLKKPHYLATGNVDFLLQAWKDLELRRILYDADLVVCDSKPIVWISRLLGNPLPERVAGSDLVPALLKVAEKKQYRVFFLGGRPDIGERAMENIRRDHPELKHLHYYSPPNRPVLEMDHEDINRRIIEARPDMIFVSFGCPKQEKWIAMNYLKTNVPMAVGVGATIGFLAGAVSRAPRWMQACGLEWFYRMMREPKRLFKRYVMGIIFFFVYIPRQLLGLSTLPPVKESASPSPTGESSDDAFDWDEISLPDRFDAAAISTFEFPDDTSADLPVLCLGNKVTFIDSTGIGELIKKNKQLRKGERPFVIAEPSAPLRRALSLMKLDDYFTLADSKEEALTLLKQAAPRQQKQQQLNSRSTQTEVQWHGEITSQNTDKLWKEIEETLDVNVPQPDTFIVNMKDVTFVDSTGVGLMVKLKKTLQARNGDALFTEIPPVVQNMLDHTNMTQFFTGKK